MGCGPPVACHERVHLAEALVTRAFALTGYACNVSRSAGRGRHRSPGVFPPKLPP